MHIRRILVLASAVMLAACESTSAPQGVEGRYNLAFVDDDDLNGFTPIADAFGMREIVSATLTLTARDEALYVMHSRPLDENGQGQAVETDTIRARYTVQDTTLAFTPVSDGRFLLGETSLVRSDRRVDVYLTYLVPRIWGGYGRRSVGLRFTR